MRKQKLERLSHIDKIFPPISNAARVQSPVSYGQGTLDDSCEVCLKFPVADNFWYLVSNPFGSHLISGTTMVDSGDSY